MTLGRLQIVEPLAITLTTGGPGGPTPATLANALTPDPKQIYAVGQSSGFAIWADLGSVQSVDSFYLGGTNAQPGAVMVISKVDNNAGLNPVALTGGVVIGATDRKAVRAHGMAKLAAPVSGRYFQFEIGNNNADWEIGRVAVGLAFEASWDREWGSGRRVIDTAKSQALLGGGFGVQPGARKAAYSWTFGDLTDAEVEQLFGIQLRVGESSPIIVNEQDGATVGANEKLHYGLLRRLEAFERRDPNATKWALEIEEWI